MAKTQENTQEKRTDFIHGERGRFIEYKQVICNLEGPHYKV